MSSLQVVQKRCREIFSWKRTWKLPWKMPLSHMKFQVKFCFSSFLRKRSLKVPRSFHSKFHTVFHETFYTCKCPISWRFSFCRRLPLTLDREEHSMDQYRSRLKLSENFERHWSIRISGKIHMDQSLVHTFSWGNSYGPMVLKVLLKFPPTLVLVHGWLFPVRGVSMAIAERHTPLAASSCNLTAGAWCARAPAAPLQVRATKLRDILLGVVLLSTFPPRGAETLQKIPKK